MYDETLQNMIKKLQKFGAHPPSSSIRYSKKRPRNKVIILHYKRLICLFPQKFVCIFEVKKVS